jgi:hypothetical protein
MCSLVLAEHPLDDSVIDIVTSELVTGSRLDLDDSLSDFADGNIERSTSKVHDSDCLVFLPAQAVSEGDCERVVDDSHHLEACDRARVSDSFALCIIERSRDGDDSACHRRADIVLSVLFQLLKHERRDLRGREFLRAGPDDHIAVGLRTDVRHPWYVACKLRRAATHESLDGEDCIL